MTGRTDLALERSASDGTRTRDLRRDRPVWASLGVPPRAPMPLSYAQAGTDLGEDDPDVLREQSREALRAYLTELAPSVRPVSVERRFELRFDGAEWSVIGDLDVEDESGDTIDVKVGAKHVSEARAESDPQPTAYELARRAEGRREGRFLFHSVRRGTIRSGERCLVVPAPRSEERLTAMEARIAQTGREIARSAESGDWPLSSPDGWWCAPGQCRFWSGCPGGGARP
jgi:PD-(D/E)XK nuclease superfamily